MRAQKTVSSLVAALACLAAPGACPSATLSKLPGAIAGVVRSSIGIPQSGAVIQLFNRQDRQLLRVVSDERGQFVFSELAPDLYSIRVTRLPFDPAGRPNIIVRAGERTLLTVSLNPLFSSIQISYPSLEAGPMSDEWKWVLRSDPATRPVFRFAEAASSAACKPAPPSKAVSTDPLTAIPCSSTARAAMFSDTRGVVRVSAGDHNINSGIATQADLGTTFALATALYGSGTLRFSGNLGYGSQSGAPAAAVRTSYSRNVLGTTPEFSLTMRQMMLPGRVAAALAGQDVSLPALRTMSASFDDQLQINEQLTLQYGSTIESISFLDHQNFVSPYARLTYHIPGAGDLEFTFTSGSARPDLAGSSAEDVKLQSGLDNLGLFPRMSLENGQARLQRGEEFEVAYSRKISSRTYRLSAYHESVANAALSMVAPDGVFSADAMPDLFSGNSTFNAGNFQSSGSSASVSQDLGEHVAATLTVSSEGALAAASRNLVFNSPEDLRGLIHQGRRNSVAGRIAATIPHAGTRVTASYQWSGSQRWAMSGNLYSTQPLRPVPGLNIFVRQPIPGLPHRIEATAELRNMLAQGYLPLLTSDGQRILVVETPRSFRGGLLFSF